MQIRIEFFRVHDGSDARARLNRIDCVTPDIEAAIAQAEDLLKGAGMPQKPDAFAIFDDLGNELYHRPASPRPTRDSPFDRASSHL